MRTHSLFFLGLAVLLGVALGCKRDAKPVPEPIEAGSGAFDQLGPIGLRIESVRLGKVRMRGMLGQVGESKDEVFVVHTRFKLLGEGPVKQPALQRDGGLFQIGEGGLKLTSPNGSRFKQVAAGGFDGVKGRRTADAILTTENPEATDVLTFESVVGADGDLTLEIPANYQTKTPEGHFLQPKEPGTFRFRIPKTMWSAPPPTTEAGPNNWATVGPLSVCVEGVRVGKVKIQGFGVGAGVADSKEDVFAISVRTKLGDPAVRVKKPQFQSDLRVGPPGGSSVVLRDVAGGEPFSELTAFGFDRIVNRQQGEVELTSDNLETRDLLIFTPKAGASNELILTLYPNWQEQKPDGAWADTSAEGEFRFRIPKSTWAR
jgi:hypothetical protein